MSQPFITDIDEAERLACKGDSLLHLTLGKAILEIRRLQQEIDDPNYRYMGRISRQAILSRNEEIDRLRGELAELKKAGQ